MVCHEIITRAGCPMNNRTNWPGFPRVRRFGGSDAGTVFRRLVLVVVSIVVLAPWTGGVCQGQTPPILSLDVESTTEITASQKAIRVEARLFTESRSVRDAFARLDEKVKSARQKLTACGFEGDSLKVGAPKLADQLFDNLEIPTVVTEPGAGTAEAAGGQGGAGRRSTHVFGIEMSGELGLRGDIGDRDALEAIAKVQRDLVACGMAKLGLEGFEERPCTACSDPTALRLMFVGRLTVEDIGLAERRCLGIAAEKAKRLSLAAGRGDVSLVSLRESIRPKIPPLPAVVSVGDPGDPLPAEPPRRPSTEEVMADDLGGLVFVLTLETTYAANGRSPD